MTLILTALAAAGAAPPAPPVASYVFKPMPLHNHGSCVVECADGSLLVCWYRGSGERTADDVCVMGARLPRNSARWSPSFVMADTPGFPDTNPCMIVDRHGALRLFWAAILDNQWASALLRTKSASNPGRRGAPRWTGETVVQLKPGPDFATGVRRDLADVWEPYRAAMGQDDRSKFPTYLKDRLERCSDKLTARLGWMPRAHPYLLGARMLLPLYSDFFDFSLFAISDDDGATWRCSAPVVGPGNVQPSLALRGDGTLVAYFRDNGPAPQRVMASESRDHGETWSRVRDTELFDPGAGLEVLVLRSGRWILVNNDTEDGRHQLAITVSEDEGRTWTVKRHLERDPRGPGEGSYSYPSVIQTRDGQIHVTYSCRPSETEAKRGGAGETIKHVRLSEEWLLAGEPIRR